MLGKSRQSIVPILALAMGLATVGAAVAAPPAPAPVQQRTTGLNTEAKRAEVAAIKARAGSGRVRVVVELRVGKNPSRRTIFGTQRLVVTHALGAAAWRDRENGESHAVKETPTTPHFTATVDAAEVDRIAAHPKVRRVMQEGAPRTPAPAAPAPAAPKAP